MNVYNTFVSYNLLTAVHFLDLSITNVERIIIRGFVKKIPYVKAIHFQSKPTKLRSENVVMAEAQTYIETATSIAFLR